jgi:hypothetical protein
MSLLSRSLISLTTLSTVALLGGCGDKDDTGNSDVTALSEQVDLLAAALDESNTRLAELETQVTACQDGLAAVEGTVTSIEGDLTDLGDAISDIEGAGYTTEDWVIAQNYPAGLGAAVNVSGDDVIFEGVNVHVRSGAGATDGAINGLGNLVVGYNEASSAGSTRTGSHNLIVGMGHSWEGYGSFVAGLENWVIGPWSSVSGGFGNIAEGEGSAISGGTANITEGTYASITGGTASTASGIASVVTGGEANEAPSGKGSVVVGGYGEQRLTGSQAAVLGGNANTRLGHQHHGLRRQVPDRVRAPTPTSLSLLSGRACYAVVGAAPGRSTNEGPQCAR